jgi:hypothetical protein
MSQWFQTPPPFPSFSNASKNQRFSKNNQAKNQQFYSRLFLWFLDFWGTLVIIKISSQICENCNYKSKVALRFWELWLCIRTWLFDFFRTALENLLQNLQLSASNFDNCPILVVRTVVIHQNQLSTEAGSKGRSPLFLVSKQNLNPSCWRTKDGQKRIRMEKVRVPPSRVAQEFLKTNHRTLQSWFPNTQKNRLLCYY